MTDKVQDLSISQMLEMSYKLWDIHKDTWSPMEPEHGKNNKEVGNELGVTSIIQKLIRSCI